MTEGTSTPHSPADSPPGFWDRMFNRLEVLDYHHPFRVLIVSLLAAVHRLRHVRQGGKVHDRSGLIFAQKLINTHRVPNIAML